MQNRIDSFSATPVDKNTAAVTQNSTKEEFIVTISQEDAEAANAKSPLDLARQYNDTIKTAINNYRVNIYRKSIRGNPWWNVVLLSICLLILVFPELRNSVCNKWNSMRDSAYNTWNNILSPFWDSLYSKFFNASLYSKFFNASLSLSNSGQVTNEKKTWEEIKKLYKKGKKLEDGDRIEYVYFTDPNYVVYRSESRIRTYINEYHLEDPTKKPLTKRYNEIAEKLSKIISKQPEELKETKTINPLIARGIRLALEGCNKEAQSVLDEAENRLKKFNNNYNKFQYLKGSFLTLICFMVFVLLLKISPILLPDMFNNIFDLLKIPEEVFIVILFGALGGFLSVASGINRNDIDLDLGSNIEILAASRIYIAVISSLIIYSALKGDIVNGISVLVKGDIGEIPVLRIAFISAVAGFVERLVPDLLNRSAESNNNNSSTSNNNNSGS